MMEVKEELITYLSKEKKNW